MPTKVIMPQDINSRSGDETARVRQEGAESGRAALRLKCWSGWETLLSAPTHSFAIRGGMQAGNGRESANATVENDETIADQRHHVDMIGGRMTNAGLCRSTTAQQRERGLISASGILRVGRNSRWATRLFLVIIAPAAGRSGKSAVWPHRTRRGPGVGGPGPLSGPMERDGHAKRSGTNAPADRSWRCSVGRGALWAHLPSRPAALRPGAGSQHPRTESMARGFCLCCEASGAVG